MRCYLIAIGLCAMVSSSLAQNRISITDGPLYFNADIVGPYNLGAGTIRVYGYAPGGASANVKFKLETASDILVVSPSTCVTPCDVDISVNPSLVALGGPGRAGAVPVTFVTVDQTPLSRNSVYITVTLVRPPSPVISSVVNAASLDPAISPGALVSIFGSSLAGTLSGAFDSGGQFPTTLGGTSVTFNGTPAALISTGAGRINAIAPYELAGQKTADVVVRYYPGTTAENISAPFSVPVVDKSLAIFTSSRTGSGQPGILNCDDAGCNANQPQNPAPVGSIVSMFGTAAGIWMSAVPNGAVSVMVKSLDYSQLSLTIGGQSAKVLYAGTAPFQVWGVFQVNAIVPTGIAPGPQPVVLTLGQLSNATDSAILFVK